MAQVQSGLSIQSPITDPDIVYMDSYELNLTESDNRRLIPPHCTPSLTTNGGFFRTRSDKVDEKSKVENKQEKLSKAGRQFKTHELALVEKDVAWVKGDSSNETQSTLNKTNDHKTNFDFIICKSRKKYIDLTYDAHRDLHKKSAAKMGAASDRGENPKSKAKVKHVTNGVKRERSEDVSGLKESQNAETSSIHYYELYEEVDNERQDAQEKPSVTKSAHVSRNNLRSLRTFFYNIFTLRTISNRATSAKSRRQKKKSRSKATAKKDNSKPKEIRTSGSLQRAPQKKDIGVMVRNQVDAGNRAKVSFDYRKSYEREDHMNVKEDEYYEMPDFKPESTEEAYKGPDEFEATDSYDYFSVNNLQTNWRTVVSSLKKHHVSKKEINPNDGNCEAVKNDHKSFGTKIESRKPTGGGLDDKMNDISVGGSDYYVNDEITENFGRGVGGVTAGAVGGEAPPPIPPKKSQTASVDVQNKTQKSKEKAAMTVAKNQPRKDPPTSFSNKSVQKEAVLPKKSEPRKNQSFRGLGGLLPRFQAARKSITKEELENTEKYPRKEYVERNFSSGRTNQRIYVALGEGEDEYEECHSPLDLNDEYENDEKPHNEARLGKPQYLQTKDLVKASLDKQISEDLYENPQTSPSYVYIQGIETKATSGKAFQMVENQNYKENLSKLSDRVLPDLPGPLGTKQIRVAQQVEDSNGNRSVGPPVPRTEKKGEDEKPRQQVKDQVPFQSKKYSAKQSPEERKAEKRTEMGEGVVPKSPEIQIPSGGTTDKRESVKPPKIVPKIPPRPSNIPQWLLLQLAHSAVEPVRKQSNPPTADDKETEKVPAKKEETVEHQNATVEVPALTPPSDGDFGVDCENELYMHLEDCYG